MVCRGKKVRLEYNGAGTEIITYLGEIKHDGNSACDGNSNKHHIELPSDIVESQCDRRAVCDSITEETDQCNGCSLAAQVGRPNFGTIDVCGTFNGGGEEGTEDEINSDGAVDSRCVGCVEVVLLESGHDTDNSGRAKSTDDCECG